MQKHIFFINLIKKLSLKIEVETCQSRKIKVDVSGFFLDVFYVYVFMNMVDVRPSVRIYASTVFMHIPPRVCACEAWVCAEARAPHLSIMKSCGSVRPARLGQVTQQIGTKLLWPGLVPHAKHTHTHTNTHTHTHTHTHRAHCLQHNGATVREERGVWWWFSTANTTLVFIFCS